TIKQILSWVDSYRRRTGQWPKYDSGPIDGIAGESWAAVDTALRYGKRGLQRAGSLAKLLARERGFRNRKDRRACASTRSWHGQTPITNAPGNGPSTTQARSRRPLAKPGERPMPHSAPACAASRAAVAWPS